MHCLLVRVRCPALGIISDLLGSSPCLLQEFRKMRCSHLVLCGLTVAVCLQGVLSQVTAQSVAPAVAVVQPTGGCPPGGDCTPINPIGKGSFGGKRPPCPVRFSKWYNGYQYVLLYGILRNYTVSATLCDQFTGIPGSYGPGLVAPSLETIDASKEDPQALYKFYGTFLPDTMSCAPAFRSWWLAPKNYRKGGYSCVVLSGDRSSGVPTSAYLSCSALRPVLCRVAASKALTCLDRTCF